ncbi:hypothetical protein TrVFT333_008901 [Trichoderma virens FT-333]|nr:hypothetical protein TrVFT333_008901 [Trichoderma virens FT-333]
MYSSRLVQVLVVVVSILCIAQATWWDNQKVHHRALIRRADSLSDTLNGLTGSSSSENATPSSSSTPTSPSQTSSSTPSETTSSDDSSSSTSASPSSTPTPDGSSSSTPAPGGTTTTPSSTSAGSTTAGPDSSSTSASAPSTTPPLEAPRPATSDGGDDKGGDSQQTTFVSTKVEVVVMTNTDGSKTTHTTTTKTTETAALNADTSKPTGMSVKTRNTIIGVVVGVGGAAILGALLLVAFRVWGRKKHAEEADGLMAYNADIVAAEKSPRGSSSGGQRNPFQSTLENYHQPVNASANF